MQQLMLLDNPAVLVSTAPEPDSTRLTPKLLPLWERLQRGPATATELTAIAGRRYGARVWDINQWLDANGDTRHVNSRRVKGGEWEYYIEGNL